jgi:hypothetical protein
MAMSQEDYMRAYVGNDDHMWKPCLGYFTPGAPLYNEEGGEILKGPLDLDAAKRLLAESGYAGQPVTTMAAQDLGSHFTPWVRSTCTMQSTFFRARGAAWPDHRVRPALHPARHSQAFRTRPGRGGVMTAPPVKVRLFLFWEKAAPAGKVKKHRVSAVA